MKLFHPGRSVNVQEAGAAPPSVEPKEIPAASPDSAELQGRKLQWERSPIPANTANTVFEQIKAANPRQTLKAAFYSALKNLLFASCLFCVRWNYRNFFELKGVFLLICKTRLVSSACDG